MNNKPRGDSAIEELFDVVEGGQGLTALSEALPPADLPPHLLERIEASTPTQGRFRCFVTSVAQLLELSEADALMWLDQAATIESFAPGLFPGMTRLHVRGGAGVANAITGFVRLLGGLEFPKHKHLGQESVLVLQGHMDDAGRVLGPGDVVVMPAGSSHAFRVLPGPDLLYLAVVQDGLQVGDLLLTPDSPQA